MHPWYKNTKGQIALVIASVVMLLLLIWSQLFRELSQDREDTLQRALQRNANLAVSWEQYTIRTLQNADEVLRLASWEYTQQGKAINLRQLYQQGVINASCFSGLVILNEKGQVVTSDMAHIPDSGMNLSDRPHFTFHKTHLDELYISEPFQSRTIHGTVIVLSRRINKPDGSFGGTVALQLLPSVFTRFYARADMRTNEILSLIAPDGITYARRTGNKESFGENICKSPLFHKIQHAPTGQYLAPDAIHGIPTYFSYRKLEHYPVIATVGSSQADIFSSYHVRARQKYVYGLGITILLVLFCMVICITLVNRKKAVRAIRESEARYRSLFENNHDAVLLITPELKLESINEAAHALFQVEAFESNRLRIEQLYQHAEPELKLSPEDVNRGAEKNEILFTTHKGLQFTGELTYSSFQNAQGKTQLVMTIRDISARKQMEQQLLQEQKKYQRKLTKQIILAQEREREAIGHELHDNINQILTTVKLYLEMAFSQHELREQLLPKSVQLVQSCIQEIRFLSHELSAPTLGTRSLVDSFKALLEQASASSSLYIQFEYDSYEYGVEKDQYLALYRILQEQLTNIVRHAEATEISIVLFQDNLYTGVTISDNGKGFDPDMIRHGIGLNNIQSRAKVLGGFMTIESVPGKGCLMEVRLPIPEGRTVEV